MMIKINSLSFSYSKRSRLFDNLNLELESGRVYGLLGKNGTGKSTLLSLITGLLFPQSGTLSVAGRTPGKRQVEFLQTFFLVPEEFDVPDVSPRVYEELYAFFYPNFSRETYDRCLSEFEIDSRQPFAKMSMGQRKKAFIAFALACNTPLLIMDEPTNGLDIPSKAQFRKLMALTAAEDRCLLISTHQVRDLDNLIDTVVVLDNHRIVFNQPTHDIAARYTFVSYSDSDKPAHPLYDEPGVLGGKAVLENTSGQASRIDTELLFNAIISGKL